MNKIAMACLGFVFLGACHDNPAAHSTPEEAAKAGLGQFQAILNVHPNPVALGVAKERASEVRLGAPLEVYMVYLSDVQKFDGSNPIIHDTGSKFYPLIAGNDVVSSLYVGGKDETHWAATSFGNPAGAKAITAVKGDFLVKVPALNVTFVASRTKDFISVTPIADDARFSFRTGQSISLTDALAAMKPYAVKIVTDAPT